MSETDEHHDRVVTEVLGDAEVFRASKDGPNGPWPYRSLTVKRRANLIRVWDVDGHLAATIEVADLPNGDEAHPALKDELETLNSKTLNEL